LKERELADEVEATLSRALVEQSLVGVYLFDERCFLYVNQALAEIFGYQPQEIIGRLGPLDLTHPDDRPWVKKKIRQRPTGELESLRYELRGLRKDGTTLWCELFGRRVQYLGRPAVIGTLVDITEHKEAEKALRESEEKYRALFEASQEGIFVIDASTGKAVIGNPFLARMLGFDSPEELVGLDPLDFVPEEDRERVRRIIVEEMFEKDLRKVHEYRAFTRDSREIWVSAIGVRINYQGRMAGLVSVRDITERKRAEEALRRYAERLRILREVDQAILQAQSAEAIAQAAAEHIRRLVPCQRVSVVLFDFEAGETTMLAAHVNGETAIGRGTRVPLSALDISEGLRRGRVHMVEDTSALPDPPEVVRRLQAEGIRSYIMIPLMVRDELIGSLNLGATEPGSFSQEQIEIAREVADSLAVAIQQAHLHEQVRRHAEELERRVAERTARLEAANQELEAFVYSVSHDLRAPLRAMEGFAQALLEDYADCLDEQGRDYARRIVAAAQRMDGLIEDLLQYSRLSRMHVEFHPVSLEQVISSVLTQLEGEIRAREAEVKVVPPFPEVLGHRSILEQVLGNLLSNALKFVPKEVRPHVRLWAEPRKRWVRIWVEDNGIGIAPEHQRRIFRIFERLHGVETYPGTGIGLALVQKGIERLGGRCGVESEVGKGSRFWVELKATVS